MAAVWELDLPQNEKLILLALADHADDQGLNCRPSVGRLAWKSGYSVRQTQAILQSLRGKGIIEPIANQRGGWRRQTHYAIHAERGAKLAPFSPPRGEVTRAEGCELTRQGVKPRAPRGEVATAPESSRTTIEPPRETHTPCQPAAGEPESALAAQLFPESAGEKTPGERKAVAPEEVLRIWQQERGSLPAVQALTTERRRKMKARLCSAKDPTAWLDDFRQAVRRGAATPFLRGDGGRWRMTLDWLIANDTNLQKVLEGAYDGGGNGADGDNRRPSGRITPTPGKYSGIPVHRITN